MRIIGIDPGYDRLGIAVIEKTTEGIRTGKDALLFSECFKTSAKDSIYARFLALGEEVSRILDEFKPEVLAIENLFISNNQKTAMRVAEARGIIIYEAEKRGLIIKEYTPMQIKSAITGDGGSDKLRMIKMVGLLIKFPDNTDSEYGKNLVKKMLDDEYDAIAVALTHSAVHR